MYDIQLIKHRINCVTYAQRIGLPIKESGDRCISPFRDGAKNPTSFVVYDDFYYDFASGNGGDVIEFCAAYAHKGDRGSAIRELAILTGVPNDNQGNSAEWLAYTQQMNAMTAYYHTQLTGDDYDYLHSRGLSDSDISRLMIGRVTDGPLRGRLFLPYFSGADGYVCYYATRALPDGAYPDRKYMKQRKDDHCQHLPWGLQTLNRESDTLVIAEGYFDAAAFEVNNYPVLSAITGRFSREQLPVVLSVARKFQRVLIIYDNDSVTHAGESFAHTMAEILTRARIPFVVGTVPQPFKDVSEYYAAGGKLDYLCDSAQDGLFYIANTFRDFESLEKFVYSVCRYTKRSKIEELFQLLRSLNRWNEKSLLALYKSCTSAPPETIIADEIMREHQIIYVHAVGFYEYANGVWNRLNESQINSYADRVYGEFSTYNRIKSVTGLLKTRALRDVLFNRQPVWNFINGTLELDTGVFRDHNPNDFCSVQADYPYNPDASYDSWSHFIDDVSSGDPRTAELLQFIPAYGLMNHTKFEKIFVLCGSGGNGKSVYLDFLRLLFGDENCSHVTPRGLLDRFQRIKLRDALMNLAGEIKSDVAEAEEYMKMVATGEPISACYKSQDFVDFITRCKLVFACNGQLSSGDTSEGLARRLIIIDFKTSFVDNPDPGNPYQRQIDVDMREKLLSELQSGGIFNWAYAGYQLLNAVGYFTETADQAELLTEFKRSSNPVFQFYESLEHRAEWLNGELYKVYRQWCEDNGYKFSASNWFHREFKNVSKNDYDSYKSGAERGYRRKASLK